MIFAHADEKRDAQNQQKGLASGAPGALMGAQEGKESCTLCIERVVMTRSDRPPEPGGREALERLLARLMVRAYLRQAAEVSEGKTVEAEPVAVGSEEVG